MLDATESASAFTYELCTNVNNDHDNEENVNSFYQKRLSVAPVCCRSDAGEYKGIPIFIRLCDSKLSRLSELLILLVQSVLTFSFLTTSTKYQFCCVVFSLLLLNSDYAEAKAQFPTLSLRWKVDKDTTKTSPLTRKKILDDIFHTSSGSLTFSMGSEKPRYPVKRQAIAPRKNFMRDHRRPQRLITKYGFYIEIRKNGKVKGTRKRNIYCE